MRWLFWHSWYQRINSCFFFKFGCFFSICWLFFLFLPSSPQAVVDVRCFSVSRLFMFSWLRGTPKTRERNHWSAGQCLCLCLGFHRSLFPRSHNCYSFFTEPLPPPPPPPPTLRSKCSPPMSCCLTVHLPTPSVPPVFVLRSDSWHRLSGRRGEGKPIRWEKLWELGKKRAPVVRRGLFPVFHQQAPKTQTSEQALSGKSLCQMDVTQQGAWRGGGRPAWTFKPFTPWDKSDDEFIIKKKKHLLIH